MKKSIVNTNIPLLFEELETKNMKIALLGFGAMGKLIANLLSEQGVEVAVIIDETDANLSANELAEKLKVAEVNQSDTDLIAKMRAEETRDTLLPFAQSSQQKLAGDAAIMRALSNLL